MFHHIEGILTETGPNLAVVDCSGVGYELCTSANTLAHVKVGERTKFYVSETIREDCFDLYGFWSRSEKRSFDLLTGVSGVGPKAAVSILSATTPEGLAMAVMTGDEKALTVAPGIGKKIAQRVILELKDKMARESADFALPGGPAAPVFPAQDKVLSDAAAALSVLGYAPSEIGAALRGLDPKALSTEELVKAALKNMMK